jgi:hypothetical protein
VKPDENLGFSDIYYRYKKNDDFERYSSIFTYAYAVGTIGLKSEQKECLMEMRNNPKTICRRFWRDIRVSIILNPTSSMFESYLRTMRRVLDIGVREFNEEFINMQDTELLNYPNLDADQIAKVKIIQLLMKFGRGRIEGG